MTAEVAVQPTHMHDWHIVEVTWDDTRSTTEWGCACGQVKYA